MYYVSLEEAKEQLTVLIERALAGEDVIITQDERPVARLVPAMEKGIKATFGSAKGLITIAEDFDEPLDDLKDYM